jgi:hypothetical protein
MAAKKNSVLWFALICSVHAFSEVLLVFCEGYLGLQKLEPKLAVYVCHYAKPGASQSFQAVDKFRTKLAALSVAQPQTALFQACFNMTSLPSCSACALSGAHNMIL